MRVRIRQNLIVCALKETDFFYSFRNDGSSKHVAKMNLYSYHGQKECVAICARTIHNCTFLLLLIKKFAFFVCMIT